MHTTPPFNRSAVFDPDTLRKLGKTFDETWAAIACNFKSNTRDAARLKLATIILDFAAEGDCNFLELKCRTIGAMQLPRAA
jgi:hypothetical protein